MSSVKDSILLKSGTTTTPPTTQSTTTPTTQSTTSAHAHACTHARTHAFHEGPRILFSRSAAFKMLAFGLQICVP